jgi:hypothetical protein
VVRVYRQVSYHPKKLFPFAMRVGLRGVNCLFLPLEEIHSLMCILGLVAGAARKETYLNCFFISWFQFCNRVCWSAKRWRRALYYEVWALTVRYLLWFYRSIELAQDSVQRHVLWWWNFVFCNRFLDHLTKNEVIHDIMSLLLSIFVISSAIGLNWLRILYKGGILCWLIHKNRKFFHPFGLTSRTEK